MADTRLRTKLCGITLKNPVLAASGTFGYGLEFENLVDLNALGGFVVKGISRQPIAGNAPPRLWEATGAMLNSAGLQNVGVEAFAHDKLPRLARVSTAVFVNVFGYSPEDYEDVVRILEDFEGAAGYELNVSCPNTAHGGMYLSIDPALLAGVVGTATFWDPTSPLRIARELDRFLRQTGAESAAALRGTLRMDGGVCGPVPKGEDKS